MCVCVFGMVFAAYLMFTLFIHSPMLSGAVMNGVVLLDLAGCVVVNDGDDRGCVER